MILLAAYGMTSLIGGAASAVGSVAATTATVGATTANQGAGGGMLDAAKQQAQAALASAAAAASSPDAERDARQTAETAAHNVARASWFSFAALIVGAVIAIVSGAMGFRHQPRLEETGGRTDRGVVATSIGTFTRQAERSGSDEKPRQAMRRAGTPGGRKRDRRNDICAALEAERVRSLDENEADCRCACT
nr:hypothetical protein [Paraburkholderia sp. BL8N3]